jgi:hypothetical protein
MRGELLVKWRRFVGGRPQSRHNAEVTELDKSYRTARRVALASIAVSEVLACSNIIIGLVAHSTSVVATGFEFAGDVLASSIVLIGRCCRSQNPWRGFEALTKHSYARRACSITSTCTTKSIPRSRSPPLTRLPDVSERP